MGIIVDESSLKPLKKLVKEEFKEVPKKPGVYVIFWVKNGEPVPIQRILGIDRKGILYIGSTRRTEGLRKRLKELWVSIQMARGQIRRKKYPHTFGQSLIYTGLLRSIKDNELWIYFKEFSKEEAEYQEKLALLSYTRKYGEPPPLNLQVGRQYFMILDLGILNKSRFVSDLDPDLKIVLGL